MTKKTTAPSRLTKPISLVLGDWSGDGHLITKTVHIKTNVTVDELDEAYQNGVKKVGIDLSEKVCRNYGDYRLPYDSFLKLIAFSELHDALFENYEEEIKAIKTEEDFTESDYNYLDYERYAKLYLGIARVGNPNIRYKFVENPSINIGGYGLFS